jgi:Mn2+/Fe2+ NRAMP family transporter
VAKPPLRSVISGRSERADPAPEELYKGSADTAAPKPGRLTFAEARKQGVSGIVRLLGPGLVTGSSDDDPSAIGTYTAVGSQFGLAMLWTPLLTAPLMIAVQELCARIAHRSGLGLGVVLRRKFPAWLIGPIVFGLLVGNTVTLGADLRAVAAGGELLTGNRVPALVLIVPVAILVLSFQVFATFTAFFRVLKWLTLVLFAYVVTAVLVRPELVQLGASALIPHFQPSHEYLLALVAVLGASMTPYLYFWQASSEAEVLTGASHEKELFDAGVDRSQLNAARLDIALGMCFAQLIVFCVMLTSGVVLNAHGQTDTETAVQAAAALRPLAGEWASVLFALGLIGTGLLAVPVLSSSATYALKEFIGFRGSLAVKARYRPAFYAVIVLATAAGVLLNFLHIEIIRALFLASVINGLLAAPLLLLVVLAGSDRKLMGEATSGRLSRTLTWTATALTGAAAIALLVTLVSLL